MKEKEFIESYEANVDAIFRFCYVKTSDREVAKDLSQETFTRAWGYVSSGKKVKHMRAFLFTTARNLVIDWYRKKKSISLDKIQEDGFEAGDDRKVGDAETEVSAAYALKLMYKLEEPYRETLHLRFVEGLEPREIGAITGEAPGTISVRIHRGLKQLEGDFNKEEHGG